MVRRHFSRLPFLVLSLSFLIPPATADYVGYFPGGESAREIDFGTGADGAFLDGPAQTGITVFGGNITIDTDVKSEFHFASFTLTGPSTLTVEGSRPLVLRVNGDVSIEGNFHVDGGSGGNSPVNTAGTAGSGGAAGGIGGLLGGGADATNGTASHSGSDAGLTLPNPAAAPIPHGGGGCFGVTGDASVQDTATAGAAGGVAGNCTQTRSAIASAFESSFSGGASGGGGASFGDVTSNANGGGGGGSGGAVRISARGTLDVTGLIQAAGGNGGNGAAGVECGASGGGGSGGAIWLQAGELFSGVTGTVSVSGGLGGTAPCGNGGDGSRGVIRIDSRTNTFAGTLSPVGADLELTITQIPVVTDFRLKGGGLFCGTTQRTSDPASGLFDLVLIFGLAWLATQGHGARKARQALPRPHRETLRHP